MTFTKFSRRAVVATMAVVAASTTGVWNVMSRQPLFALATLLVALVTALGCAEAQGYHYGRPMSEEQFLEWLQVHQKGIA